MHNLRVSVTGTNKALNCVISTFIWTFEFKIWMNSIGV